MALGPLTNLARLERQRPGALSQAAAVVVMGGAVDTPGNSTPYAEFNFYSDPLAAQETLASSVSLTLVDLGACRQVAIGREAAARLRADNRLGQLAVELVQKLVQVGRSAGAVRVLRPAGPGRRPVPELLTTRRATVVVETAVGPELAASRVTAPDGPVSVVERVDTERFFALMGEWLGLAGWGGVSRGWGLFGKLR